MMKIAYLGPEGTFSEEAALRYFNSDKTDWQICETISDVLHAVNEGTVQRGFVPIENSIEGTINMTLDGLLKYDLYIKGEVILPVSLHLLTLNDVELEQITEVWSIPPALAQCRNFIRGINAKSKHFNSTASAAKALSDQRKPYIAAVASERSAYRFDLKVAKKNIQDYKENETRFVEVVKNPNNDTETSKTMVLVTPTDEHPGILATILNVFSSLSINLTWIESRPTKKKLGTYCFFIEAATGKGHVNMKKAVSILQIYGYDVRILGSYNTTKL